MSECQDCGTGNRGAFLIETDDGTYCENCVGAGECSRCGRETSQLTMTGEFLCEHCSDTLSDQQQSRAMDQSGLGEFANE